MHLLSEFLVWTVEVTVTDYEETQHCELYFVSVDLMDPDCFQLYFVFGKYLQNEKTTE